VGTATIFDVQRLCVHDGPGIRTTVFFKGCPLRCDWCQNPESQSVRPQLMFYPARCISCGACREVCGLQRNGGALSIPADCVACGQCAEACPTEARRMAGRCMSVEDALAAALRDKPFYRETGGVTLGGGEPLAQWPFVRELADRLRAEHVHVALDTACAAPDPVFREIPERIDLVLADLKMVSAQAHKEWTGADNAGILRAIRFLARAMPGRLLLSLPLIPGVHDRAEFERMADFIAALEPVPPVRLIPYHQLGNAKYEALGRPVPCRFVGPVDTLRETAVELMRTRSIEILT